MIAENILELIGNTPIVEVKCFDVGICRLFLKLENVNPGGSIKDRIGLSMVDQAEREGKLRPGDTIIEATAGNTGLGLALAAIKKGYKLILVIPDKMSREKIFHLRAMGVEIVLTRSDVEKGHPEYYQDLAQSLADGMPNSFYVNQFENAANPLAHETGTGPEIWSQTGHDVDAVVVGVGSAGTIAGLSAFFKKVNPQIDIVLADPHGSILAQYVKSGTMGKAGSWLVEGIGEDFIPSQADFDLVKHAYTITDEESFETARALLRYEGILAGSSSGTLVAAAVRYAREQKEPKRIVTFVCDSGNKYLSKMFNDNWMSDQGFTNRAGDDNAFSLVSRKIEEGEVVFARSGDTILSAYNKMKLYDISQLPVLEDAMIVGILDESDILIALTEGGDEAFWKKVSDFMSKDLITVLPSAGIEDVLPVLKKGLVAVVKDDERFYGLITRIDFLSYLRGKIRK